MDTNSILEVWAGVERRLQGSHVLLAYQDAIRDIQALAAEVERLTDENARLRNQLTGPVENESKDDRA